MTPNDAIRKDIIALNDLEPSLNLLNMFDNLATTNMKFDVWRYTKLYLEGGLYADVDVEPLERVVDYATAARKESKPVIFEESSWPNNALSRFLIPLLSDYDELPAYGTCVVISAAPKSDFFLDLLRDMHPDEWLKVREPKRTLMSVGPGHVTQFVKRQDPSKMLLVGYKDRRQVYIHHGFGTWKSWMPKEYLILGNAFIVIIVLLALLTRYNHIAQRLKRIIFNVTTPRVDEGEGIPVLLRSKRPKSPGYHVA